MLFLLPRGDHKISHTNTHNAHRLTLAVVLFLWWCHHLPADLTLSAASKYWVKERIDTNLDCAYLLKYILFVIIAVENKDSFASVRNKAPYHEMIWGRVGTPALIFTFGTGWRWVVRLTLRYLYLYWVSLQYLFNWKLGGSQSRYWRFWEEKIPSLSCELNPESPEVQPLNKSV